MKIRNKLSLLFTGLTAAILLTFATLVYYSAYQNRENDFYNSLKKEAITKANIFFNAKVDAQTLQTIYKNNREILNEVEVAIYDTSFTLLYHDAVNIDVVKETKPMIDRIQAENEIRFFQDKWQVLGILLPFKGRNYVITATAYDQYGYNKLANLSHTIWIVFVGSILLLYVAGQFFSKKALSLVTEMVSKVKKITATNLDLRLNNNNGKDELAELANTFNEMLDRLEKSFGAQKEFVSNISHELRTPLAAIITELELATHKDRTQDAYKAVINNALADARKLAKLTHSLLDFAKANYDLSGITFKKLRLDEVLLDAQEQVAGINPVCQISISFADEVTEMATDINGNEYLLKTAFANLMENACKFSPTHRCEVTISFNQDTFVLKFTDYGIGIPQDDLPFIFRPFHRGHNKQYAEGNGIGLSLTQKIIQLHHGQINVVSKVQQGSIFTIELPI